MSSEHEIPGIAELLTRARAGDREAENVLFGQLHARILALAKRRTGNAEVAEDITQETMRTVYEKYATIDVPTGLLPWVFRILHHKVGNHLKRSRTEARYRGTLTWETIGLTPEGERAAFDLVRTLRPALQSASAECRKIFRLLLRGAQRREIQRAFGDEPIGTVDSRISRCRKRLLARLERRWAND